MTRDEVLAELRKQSEAGRRVKYDGHNRRPIALSLRRLRWRWSRRRGREFLRSYLRTHVGTAVLRRWASLGRDGRCGHRFESFQLGRPSGHALPGGRPQDLAHCTVRPAEAGNAEKEVVKRVQVRPSSAISPKPASDDIIGDAHLQVDRGDPGIPAGRQRPHALSLVGQ